MATVGIGPPSEPRGCSHRVQAPPTIAPSVSILRVTDCSKNERSPTPVAVLAAPIQPRT